MVRIAKRLRQLRRRSRAVTDRIRSPANRKFPSALCDRLSPLHRGRDCVCVRGQTCRAGQVGREARPSTRDCGRSSLKLYSKVSLDDQASTRKHCWVPQVSTQLRDLGISFLECSTVTDTVSRFSYSVFRASSPAPFLWRTRSALPHVQLLPAAAPFQKRDCL